MLEFPLLHRLSKKMHNFNNRLYVSLLPVCLTDGYKEKKRQLFDVKLVFVWDHWTNSLNWLSFGETGVILFVRWILRAGYTAQTLQLGCYPGERASLKDERVLWCGVGVWWLGRSEGWGEEGEVSSGSRGEHCLRLGRDERGCLCQSLIPPFGK